MFFSFSFDFFLFGDADDEGLVTLENQFL